MKKILYCIIFLCGTLQTFSQVELLSSNSYMSVGEYLFKDRSDFNGNVVNYHAKLKYYINTDGNRTYLLEIKRSSDIYHCNKNITFIATQQEIETMYRTLENDFINNREHTRTSFKVGKMTLSMAAQPHLDYVMEDNQNRIHNNNDNKFYLYIELGDNVYERQCSIKIDLEGLKKLFGKSRY